MAGVSGIREVVERHHELMAAPVDEGRRVLAGLFVEPGPSGRAGDVPQPDREQAFGRDVFGMSVLHGIMSRAVADRLSSSLARLMSRSPCTLATRPGPHAPEGAQRLCTTTT